MEYADGPVTVRRRVLTTQQKGFQIDDPFYSDIEIRSIPSGLRVIVTARAPDHVIAYQAAVFFFGHMLDALTLAVNCPMYLSLTEREYVPSIDKERAKKGSKNQVWECFKALWGPCEAWPVIPGQSKWIDDSYSVRLDVAHGMAFVDIHKVTEVAKRLPAIEEVCYHFLRGWRDRFLDLDRHPPSKSLSEVDPELLPG